MLSGAAVLLALILGLAAGGRIKSLDGKRISWAPYVLVLFVVQAVARGRLWGLLPPSGGGRLIWVITSLCICAMLAGDLKKPGIPLVVTGFSLNVLVVLVNSGMPVLVEASQAARAALATDASAGFYSLANPGSILPALADSIPLQLGSSAQLLSVGDLMVVVGVVAAIVGGMKATGMAEELVLH